MFRNQLNSQLSSPPEIGLDVEENYEFSGSKLKITTLTSSSIGDTNNMAQNQHSSAVLSGTDVVSPIPGSPIANNAINQSNNSNSYQSTGKLYIRFN